LSGVCKFNLPHSRSAIQSQALVYGLSTDFRSKPRQWMEIMLVLRWNSYRPKIKRTGPDDMKRLEFV
jgi:hypothetical protein